MIVDVDKGAEADNIVDYKINHDHLCDWIREMTADSEIEVIPELFDAENVLTGITQHSPEVAILDVRVSESDGLSTLGMIKVEFPQLPVLVLSTLDEPTLIARTIALEGDGFLLKTASKEIIVAAINALSSGNEIWTKELIGRVAFQLEEMEKRDSSGNWMYGRISCATFVSICGCCREEAIEDLWDTFTALHQAEKLGWSINASGSWPYQSVIRCPQCTVTDPCPNCGETELIAIGGKETPICMECETERLTETLGIIQ